jgi:hypothetical protein
LFTVYDSDTDNYTKVEEPDPSLTYTYAAYLKWNFEDAVPGFALKMNDIFTK